MSKLRLEKIKLIPLDECEAHRDHYSEVFNGCLAEIEREHEVDQGGHAACQWPFEMDLSQEEFAEWGHYCAPNLGETINRG